jgi:hypothetical protein
MFFNLINKKITTKAIFLFCIAKIYSQEKIYPLDTPIFKDTITQFGIPLKEVVLFQPLKFRTIDELKDYLILRRRVIKVYPYAKLASDRLMILNKRLKNLKSKRSKKKYLRRLEKFLYVEFEQELKKLSRSQGKILIKLVHRQTGITIFELIKELRNGLKAFFYQTTASLFKLSLKDKFNPEDILEDYLIEDILQRAFSEKYLVEQNAKIDYDLDSLYSIWKTKR